MRKPVGFAILTLLGFISVSPSPAAGPVRVAILPFQAHSSEDLGYLQKGILDMLSSRVVRGGGVQVMDRASVLRLRAEYTSGLDMLGAAALGKKLGADFLVFGSITKLGKRLSLDGEVVDVRKGKSSARLLAETPDLDSVIPQMGRLAQEIRRGVLGQAKTEAPSGSVQAAPPVAALPQQKLMPGAPGTTYPVPPGGYPVPPGGFTGRGEDDLFTRSDEPLIHSEGKSLNPAFIMSYQADKARRGYVKSPELASNDIQAMDVGDTDGDGAPETVLADEDRLYIYQDVLLDTAERVVINPPTVRAKILSLDVADINHNGVDEIYVTAVELRGEALSSYVVEYQEGAYKVVAERLPYFLRVTRSLQEGLILLGQEKGARIFADRLSEGLVSPFSTIFRLRWEGGALVKGETLHLKENVSVLGLTMVDVDHDGVEEYLVFDKADHLKLFNARGGMVWVSQDPFGRTGNYFLKDFDREIAPNEEPMSQRTWLPARILTVDLDEDGFEEVILCHNYEPISLLSQIRIFTKSAIFSLSWDGLDFMENWRTREMKGYVADYQVKDVDHDGKPELLVGLVYKRGALDYLKTSASLIAYDLRVAKAKGSREKGKDEKGLKGAVPEAK